MMRNDKGFTLVEVLIVLILLTSLVLMVGSFFVSNLRSYAITSAKSELFGQAQSSLDVISDDIRNSSSATASNQIADNNSPTSPDLYGWVGDGSTLILRSAVVDASGNLLYADPESYTTHKDNVIYFLRNGNLYRRELANNVAGNSLDSTCPKALATPGCPPDRLVAQEVSDLDIQYLDASEASVPPDGARSVELTIKFERSVFNTDVSVEYKTRTVFRND